MQKISIVGSSSFIGKHLLHYLDTKPFKIKALSKSTIAAVTRLRYPQVQFFQGDLLDPHSLNNFIEADDIVINLSYMADAPLDKNLNAVKNLADVCKLKNIQRLIHCSTAVVAGAANNDLIDEETICLPKTTYEITKFAIEQLLLTYQASFKVFLLRPTAVFGAQGKNLLKLIHDLSHGASFKNYLKSCVFSQRKMNLVCIENVVAAIDFLITIKNTDSKNVFIISDDDDLNNNYQAVECYLLQRLNKKYYSLPPLKLPFIVLRALYALAGKGAINPKQIYLTKNLSQRGFKKNINFQDGLKIFMDWQKELGSVNVER